MLTLARRALARLPRSELGLWFMAPSRRIPPVHDGSTILADPHLIGYLRRRPYPAPTDPADVARLLRGRVLEVPGGLLVSSCGPEPRHRESVACWSFYAEEMPS
jgi:hypothetical protein